MKQEKKSSLPDIGKTSEYLSESPHFHLGVLLAGGFRHNYTIESEMKRNKLISVK